MAVKAICQALALLRGIFPSGKSLDARLDVRHNVLRVQRPNPVRPVTVTEKSGAYEFIVDHVTGKLGRHPNVTTNAGEAA